MDSGGVERPERSFDPAQYIVMGTGVKVSRKAVVCGSQNVVIGAKSVISEECVVRGDLKRAGATQKFAISTGTYCFVEPRVVIKPPYRYFKGKFNYFPMKVGDYVHIEEGSIVAAATIGSYVHIGKNCVIGNFAVLKDCCVIEDGAFVPPHTMVPSFSVYGGRPAQCVAELPESSVAWLQDRSKDLYTKFVPAKR